MKKILTYSVVWAALLILVSVNTASARHEMEIEIEHGVEVEIEIEHGVEVEVEHGVEIERHGGGDTRPFEKFEGIWQILSRPNLFISLHDEHLAVIAIVININTFESSFMLGNRSGNSATLTTSSGAVSFDATLSGLSKKQATLTINICVPQAGSSCILEEGATLDLLKVY